jgi:hypothetical protein
MNRKLQVLIFVAACVAVFPAVSAGQSVTGVYERFTVGKGSGDLEGMRVTIFRAGANDAYHAIVQIAQGGAEDPEPVMVDVTIKGKRVSFAVDQAKFTGTVTAARLVIKQEGGSTEYLARKPASSFFR